MRILYISQFYEPENIAPAFRATEHSRIWVSEGADVTVLTGYPNYPIGKVFDGYEVQLLHEEELCGVRLLRSKLIAKPNTNFVNRIQNGLSFFLYGMKNLRANKKAFEDSYDVVFATSGTVFAGYLGYRYAKKLHLPFVIEYRDLTYSQLIATGTSKGSLKYKGMKWLELMMAKKASKVIVLTNSFKSTLAADGVDVYKIVVVPNGADIVELSPINHQGLKLGYFGTMGLSQVIPETIRVFSCLDSVLSDFEYLLIGEGAARSSVEEAASGEGAGFVRLLRGMSKDELEPFYAELDMSVVSLRKSNAFSGTIPSKIFQSWARGIPVLFYGPDGEAARMIRGYGLGITLCGTDDENRQILTDFFDGRDWKHDLKNMREQARSIMTEHYTRDRLAKALLKELETV
jgi:colanic acid biosynthesis glycosyl transferase WcaI